MTTAQPRRPPGPGGGQYAPSAADEGDLAALGLAPHATPSAVAFAWPATTEQQVAWQTNPDQHGPDGRRPNYADRMLTSITVEVPPRIAEAPVNLPSDLVEQCRAVEADILRLDARYGESLAGLTSFLIRSESVASSRIERVYADLDEVARASIAEEASEAARTTAAAAEAMTALVGSQQPGEPLEEERILAAHRALLHRDPLEGEYAGRYRDMQNWLGGSDFSPRDAVHIPPPPEHVEPLMDDLVRFVNRNDISPLAHAALAHGQFEAIHPFTDGNGRIGRALIAVVLRRDAVARQVVIPVAATMLADVDTYFDALIGYRRGDAAGLVGYMASAADAATREAAVSAERLTAMPAAWREQARPRRNSSADRLLGHLLASPVLNAAAAMRLTGSTAPRTYEALDRLVEAEVLREITGGGRNRVWIASDVMTEVADLDERIGKRAKPSPRWQ